MLESGDSGLVTVHSGIDEGRQSIIVFEVDIGAKFEQSRYEIGLAEEQCAAAIGESGIDFGAGLSQQFEHIGTAMHGGNVQRRHTIVVAQVNVTDTLQHDLENLFILRIAAAADHVQQVVALSISAVDVCTGIYQ